MVHKLLLAFCLFGLIKMEACAQATLFYSGTQKVLFFDFSDFNKVTAEYNYPAMDNKVVSIGGGLLVRGASRTSAGLEFAYTSGFEKENTESNSVKFEGFGVHLNFQYQLNSGPGFSVHPLATIGFRKYNLSLIKGGESISLSQLLNQSDKNISKLSNPGYFVELGVGIDKLFSLKMLELGVGLKAGYRLDSGEWKFEGVQHLSEPLVKLDAPFVGVRLLLSRPKVVK